MSSSVNISDLLISSLHLFLSCFNNWYGTKSRIVLFLAPSFPSSNLIASFLLPPQCTFFHDLYLKKESRILAVVDWLPWFFNPTFGIGTCVWGQRHECFSFPLYQWKQQDWMIWYCAMFSSLGSLSSVLRCIICTRILRCILLRRVLIGSFFQIEHQSSTCPLRLIMCRFCGDMVQAGSTPADARDRLRGLVEHESICGSRTAPCDSCGRAIMLKEMDIHVIAVHQKS